MEIESHEYEPTTLDQNQCIQCSYRPNHPIHGISRALGIQEPVIVDVNAIPCNHESWECSGPSPIVRHRCTECNWCWTNFHKPGFVYCDECKPEPSMKFITKDSGKREEYDSGMKRDVQEGKDNFFLLVHEGIPYEDQFLTRLAQLLTRGAQKYSKRNFEKANGEAEMERAKESLFRHMMQYLCGETDEDHGMAICFNVMLVELVKTKMRDDTKNFARNLWTIGPNE